MSKARVTNIQGIVLGDPEVGVLLQDRRSYKGHTGGHQRKVSNGEVEGVRMLKVRY